MLPQSRGSAADLTEISLGGGFGMKLRKRRVTRAGDAHSIKRPSQKRSLKQGKKFKNEKNLKTKFGFQQSFTSRLKMVSHFENKSSSSMHETLV